MTDKIIDLKQVLGIVPYSRTQIWRLEKQGDFPQRVRIGKNRVGWWHTEIMGWLREKSNRRSATISQRGRD